jgi:hypothetical protein
MLAFAGETLEGSIDTVLPKHGAVHISAPRMAGHTMYASYMDFRSSGVLPCQESQCMADNMDVI